MRERYRYLIIYLPTYLRDSAEINLLLCSLRYVLYISLFSYRLRKPRAFETVNLNMYAQPCHNINSNPHSREILI